MVGRCLKNLGRNCRIPHYLDHCVQCYDHCCPHHSHNDLVHHDLALHSLSHLRHRVGGFLLTRVNLPALQHGRKNWSQL